MKRRALVTGASGAIGAAICRRLAADGCEVILHAHRNLEAAQALASELGGAQAISFDVTDGAAARAALEPLVDDSAIQIVVNNAGVHDDAPFAGMSEAQWRHVIDVSLHGFFNVTQPLVLPMIRTRWGRIVTVTSVAAELGNRGQANYSAAKGALHAASRSLARELGSRGVTVNCVSPGIIESPMTTGLFDAAAIAHLVPLQRMGQPDDVAGVVAFLASDAAGYITGQVVPVNGGMR
ncbi:MAG TPA: 3-oxoacyl-ACP reductase FabG [Usitatibacter sp.]|jgi:3-oxoacyl-[acyl-carrier protein] reductase|nr:3-oxoacyl-ACP reductase FabG [Usitatibacter sp.]